MPDMMSFVGAGMDEPATDAFSTPPTQGHNMKALAMELELAQNCPVCLSGALERVWWHSGTPSWLTFNCGHTTGPIKSGRHRAIE